METLVYAVPSVMLTLAALALAVASAQATFARTAARDHAATLEALARVTRERDAAKSAVRASSTTREEGVMSERGKDELRMAKLAVRQPYAWPGGYPVFVVCADGELLCADCVRRNWRRIVFSTRWDGCRNSGWAVAGSVIPWEDEPGEARSCGHCGARLQSAYGASEEGRIEADAALAQAQADAERAVARAEQAEAATRAACAFRDDSALEAEREAEAAHRVRRERDEAVAALTQAQAALDYSRLVATRALAEAQHLRDEAEAAAVRERATALAEAEDRDAETATLDALAPEHNAREEAEHAAFEAAESRAEADANNAAFVADPHRGEPRGGAK